MSYALHWKGKRLPGMTFKTKKEAVTTQGIESMQMELAEYSPTELDKFFKVKKVK